MANWIAQNITGIGFGVIWGVILMAAAMAGALAFSDARNRRRMSQAHCRRMQQSRAR